MRFSALSWIVVLGCLAGACGSGDELLNSCPRLTGVQVAGWDGAELRVGVWVQDLEGDPVDLVVTDGSGNEVPEVLGHGAVGLTSEPGLPGAAHELIIEGKHVKGDSMGFLPVDIEGCEGEEVRIDVPAVGVAGTRGE